MSQMIIMLIVGAAALFLFGCRLGIKQICELTKQSPGGGAAVGGGAGLPMDETGAIDLESMDPEQVAQLKKTFGEEFPRVTLTEAMEFIANQAVLDIDKYTYAELGRTGIFELKAEILDDYQGWLTQIAEYNDVRLQPLQGRALAKYSSMILDVCRRKNIRLNPQAEAMFRSNLFAGSPTQGNVTSNMALSIS
jgi:hypothetical protein